MSHNKPVLLVGGPADGQRIVVSASARIHNTCEYGLPDNEDQPPSRTTAYALQALQGASHEVFHVGVTDLSVCIARALVAGYRKPKAHDSDMNVALQMVTFIGGESDGQRLPAQSLQTHINAYPNGPVYEIVRLPCKGGTKIRVAVLDATIDTLPLLIEGYRFGEPK